MTVPPAQVVEALGVRATATLLGSMSESTAEVRAMVLGLLIVIVSVDEAPRATELGLNALAMMAGARTCRVAAAEAGLLTDEPPIVAVTAPMAIRLL